MSGWMLKDELDDHVFTFQVGTELDPAKYLVVCENAAEFQNIYPKVHRRIGDMDFKFSNDGEVIRLYDSAGILIDSVRYDDKDPWPEAADGSGATLELLDPALNNDLAESWIASLDLGSPGRKNHTVTGLADNSNKLKDYVFLYQNYPNPATNYTVISYSVKHPGLVQLKVYDIMGREVRTLVNRFQQAMEYSISFDTADLQNGIYLYSLQITNNVVESRKMIVYH
jgi:hypothetical protein